MTELYEFDMGEQGSLSFSQLMEDFSLICVGV